MKRAACLAFHYGGGLALTRWFRRSSVRILMYHRFHDRAGLARQCAHIRRCYHPVSMSEIGSGRPLPSNALAITVDDGYRDFYDIARPVFETYGIPVTIYPVTDFLDGKAWLWPDVVRYASAGDVEQIKKMPNAQRLAILRKIDVTLPPEYRPLTWDQVREMARSGLVEFGAHTKSHPILSSLAAESDIREEIAGSKSRIEAELGRPVLHFCYPNGRLGDIGERAFAAVKAAGFRTAITSELGLNDAATSPLLLRRIGVDFSLDELYFARRAAGVEVWDSFVALWAGRPPHQVRLGGLAALDKGDSEWLHGS